MCLTQGIITVVVFPLLVGGVGRRDFDHDLLHDIIEAQIAALHRLTYLTERCLRRELICRAPVWRLYRDFDIATSCLTGR